MKNRFSAAALGLAVTLTWARSGLAQEVFCNEQIDRRNLVACALEASPALRAEEAMLRAGQGRLESAGVVLPGNPFVSGSVASRVGPTDRAINWSVTLGQELEVAGQRSLRIDLADAELRSAQADLAAVRAQVAEQAWLRYFELEAATERTVLSQQLMEAAKAVAETVKAMTTGGLASEVDADVADVVAVRAAHEALVSTAELSTARIRLAVLLGQRSVKASTSALEPLHGVAATLLMTERPELLAVKGTAEARARRIDLLRRSRVPNPSVSAFVQNDGFNERVLGIGLSVPIPLPHPLGRTQAGHIAEASAEAQRAESEVERVSRAMHAEASLASSGLETAQRVRALYTPERVSRALTNLRNISLQLKAARISVRDAFVAQQAFVELMRADIDARLALCVESVRLARAQGLSLEGASL